MAAAQLSTECGGGGWFQRALKVPLRFRPNKGLNSELSQFCRSPLKKQILGNKASAELDNFRFI